MKQTNNRAELVVNLPYQRLKGVPWAVGAACKRSFLGHASTRPPRTSPPACARSPFAQCGLLRREVGSA